MEFMPIWFAFAAIINVVLVAFALWLVWVLVSSVRGIHQELVKIRNILGQERP